MLAQIALVCPRRPRFRHFPLPLHRFQAHFCFLRTAYPVPEVVERMTRVVGRRVERVMTVAVAAAVCHFDTIGPDPVKELHSVGSMPPALLHST